MKSNLIRIAVVGDYNPSFRPHQTTDEAIEHSRTLIPDNFEAEWVSTLFVEQNFEQVSLAYDGFWIAPGSPYKSIQAVLQIIEHCRLNKIPCLGTCGGFQHMALEFAQNVLEMKSAEHAEHNFTAPELIVTPLSCNLKGEPLEVEIINKNSKCFSLYNSQKVSEKYYCNFELNPDYESKFNDNNFQLVGSDSLKEARILEMKNHPFFIATLFVPQDNSSQEKPHPLVTGFIRSVIYAAKNN